MALFIIMAALMRRCCSVRLDLLNCGSTSLRQLLLCLQLKCATCVSGRMQVYECKMSINRITGCGHAAADSRQCWCSYHRLWTPRSTVPSPSLACCHVSLAMASRRLLVSHKITRWACMPGGCIVNADVPRHAAAWNHALPSCFSFSSAACRQIAPCA